MAIPIQLKRSTAAGVSPTTLADGEVAINVAASDPKLFYKDSVDTIRAFSLASYASATHTHTASQVSVAKGNGATAFIGVTASQFLFIMDDDNLKEAVLESGGLDSTTINDFASEAAKYGPVTSVNSLTGTIVLTSLGVSAASAVHSHVAADISDFTSVANVVSVNAKTGVVSISHTDVTAASASHTHAASDVTSGTFDAARLPLATTGAAGAVIVGTGLGVSSGTVSVTYGTNSTSSCRGDDSRLSDTRTPTDGSVTTAKIANDAVTYAKLQNISATDRLLGRSSAGAGDVEEVTCTAFGRSLIDDADAAAARTTLGAAPTASPTFTGTVTVPGLTATAAILADDLSSTNSVVYSFDGDPNTGIGRGGADVLTVVTNGTERMRVNADGEVLIDIADQGAFKLQVSGTTYMENLRLSATTNRGRLTIDHNGATTFAAGWNNTDTGSAGQTTLNILRAGTSVGSINTTNTATSFNTSSDYRLKRNLRPIANATERLSLIKASQWDWHLGGVGEGFIAHELAEVVPLAVSGEKDAVDADGNPVWQSVDMSKVVPLLVAALQEANARIAALEERLSHA